MDSFKEVRQMAIAALSPNSVMASPIQVNPQANTDLQTKVPQNAQDAQKVVKAVQTDTVTISPQALKLADDKNAATKEATKRADDQQALKLAGNKDDAAKRAAQKSAEKAYAAIGGQG
jgi:hypothetical protein